MSIKSKDPEYFALQTEIEKLKSSIKNLQKGARDGDFQEVTSSVTEALKLKLTTKRYLKGHIHKVNGVAFSGDSRHLVSGSLDGKLIVWDTWTGNKVQVIPLRSSWIMAVAYSPSGNYVASGGMDNLCTVYDLNTRSPEGETKILRELAGYDGFLSCCKFIDDKVLVTGSGDMKLSKWDLETGKRDLELYGHAGDVVSMTLHPDNENILITGSVDTTAKLWDLRLKTAQQTFFGHDADVNAVQYHPSSLAFVSASEDSTARLFDIRADQEISQYKTGGKPVKFTSAVLSKSGRYLLAGGDDGCIPCWDLLKTNYLGMLSGHDDRVTSLAIPESGLVIASSSWDQNIRIWL